MFKRFALAAARDMIELMRLIKHRPKILLRAAAEVHPGERFEVEAIIDVQRPLALAYVDIALRGVEQATIGGGGRTMTQRAELVVLEERLLGPSRLPAGQRRLRCCFALPEDAPPSYRGASGGMEYHLEVHAAIPWWPGVRERFELKVSLPPPPPLPPKPVLFSSAPAGPRGRALWLEGSLAASSVACGSRLSGALALGNVDHHRLRSLRLALVAEETITLRPAELVGPRMARLEARRLETSLPLPERLHDGQTLPFELELPAELPPSYTAQRWRLSWYIELLLRVRWGRDVRLRVPVTIVARRHRGAVAAPRLAPPSVGSERLGAIWSAVAAQLELRYEEQALRGTVGEVSLELRREHRGRRGVFLIGELSYPDLGLDLGLHPTRGFGRRWLAGRGAKVSLGDERFDQLQRLEGRDPEQVAAVLKMLLASLDPFLPVVAMDDRNLVVERRDGGQRAQKLRRLATRLLTLAREVAVARGAIPPSAPFAHGLASWRELASRLGAELQTGAMRIHGRYRGQDVRVRTRWSAGCPEHTLLTMRPAVALPEGVTVVLRCDGDAEPSALRERLPDAGRAVLERLCARSQGLRVGTSELALELEAPLREPLAVLERLDELTRLARWLTPSQGPYR